MPKPRKMLGNATSPYILSLMSLIETQSKVTLANWAIDYAETYILPIYEKRCPGDNRPRRAMEAARDWLAGKVKLPYVKNIIERMPFHRAGVGRTPRRTGSRTDLRSGGGLHPHPNSCAGAGLLRRGGHRL